MKNKISVLMTVYNCELFVEQSIKSILNQSYRNFELIIIDDCSNDSSLEKIRSFKDERIKIFSLEKKLGRTKALNFGLTKCQSKIISIQDADDISEKERLAKSISKLDTNNEIGMVCTNYEFINSKNETINKKKRILDEKTLFSKLLYFNLIAHSSITFKRVLPGINEFLYDENYIYAQDYNLILRYLRDSKILLIKENLVRIRDYEGNMSNVKKYAKIRLLENLKLLEFSKKNFKIGFFEKIKIEYFKLKNHFKLLWENKGE